jgi:hypothetical protein
MANTTWNGADILGCSLGGTNNLTVSGVTAAGAVRTIDKLNSGKLYFEYTCTTWTSNCGVGVANSRAVLSTVAGNPLNASFVQGGNGNVWVNGAQVSGASLGARANGDVIGVAIDLNTPLIWYRVAPSGNWNNAAGANPATGVGGIPIISITSALIPLFGLFAVNSNVAQSITANFGDSAFVGAVPAGFTGGFTSGFVLPANEAIATQVTLEEFYTAGTGPNEVAWATQVGMEMWVSAATQIPEQMMVTQAALEMWIKLTPPVAGPQTRVQVMA